MAVHNLEDLAAQLGRPPRSLAAFEQLTPQQVQLLSAAVEQACARQRSRLDSAADAPRALRWLLRALIRPLLK